MVRAQGRPLAVLARAEAPRRMAIPAVLAAFDEAPSHFRGDGVIIEDEPLLFGRQRLGRDSMAEGVRENRDVRQRPPVRVPPNRNLLEKKTQAFRFVF